MRAIVSGMLVLAMMSSAALAIGPGDGIPDFVYDPVTGMFTPTGNMSTSRTNHTATLLPNGRVLVIGGLASGTSSELWDPTTGSWSTAGPASGTDRTRHTATLLDDGRVLVVGGSTTGGGGISGVSQTFDP